MSQSRSLDSCTAENRTDAPTCFRPMWHTGACGEPIDCPQADQRDHLRSHNVVWLTDARPDEEGE